MTYSEFSDLVDAGGQSAKDAIWSELSKAWTDIDAAWEVAHKRATDYAQLCAKVEEAIAKLQNL